MRSVQAVDCAPQWNCRHVGRASIASSATTGRVLEGPMLEKTARLASHRLQRMPRSCAAHHPPRRCDPGGAAAEDADEDVGRDHHGRPKSAGADRSGGRHRRLGRSRLRADHDRRHPGRARRRRARPSRADADRQGCPRLAGAAPGAASRAARQRRRAFGGRDGGARSDRPRVRPAPDRSRRPPAPQRREADVAPRQQDRRGGRRRSARQAEGRASISSSSRSA